MQYTNFKVLDGGGAGTYHSDNTLELDSQFIIKCPYSQAEPEEVPQTGSYDKLNLRPSLPRQAKNKKEQ